MNLYNISTNTHLSPKILLSIILILVQFAMVEPTVRHHHLEDEFKHRVSEMQKWNCGTPKPRLVYVGDEHRHLVAVNYLWFPPAAVVFRCEQSSGCCTNPMYACQSEAEEQVSILFKQVDAVTTVANFVRLDFSNHTSCRCIQKSL